VAADYSEIRPDIEVVIGIRNWPAGEAARGVRRGPLLSLCQEHVDGVAQGAGDQDIV
jgi:hypothetical protein